MNLPTHESFARAGLAAVLCVGIAALMAGSAPVAAAADADAPLRTISVSGHGEMKGTPDEAHLSAGVVTEGKTAAEALAANSQAMNDVFAALKRMGIPENKIQTANFSVEPQYPPYNSNGPQPVRRIIGYSVSNTVGVTVAGIDKVGPVLDLLVKSGANQTSGISFDIADTKPLEEKARRAAVEAAMAKARTLADAAGVHLGPILSINEGGYARPPLPMRHMDVMAGMAAPAPAPPPVAAGEENVSVDVSIIYAIE